MEIKLISGGLSRSGADGSRAEINRRDDNGMVAMELVLEVAEMEKLEDVKMVRLLKVTDGQGGGGDVRSGEGGKPHQDRGCGDSSGVGDDYLLWSTY